MISKNQAIKNIPEVGTIDHSQAEDVLRRGILYPLFFTYGNNIR